MFPRDAHRIQNLPSEFPRMGYTRLSGKYLNRSDRAFLGSAERRKLRHFAPSCGLLGPRNGARSEFPDSLSRKLDEQSRLRTPRYLRSPQERGHPQSIIAEVTL